MAAASLGIAAATSLSGCAADDAPSERDGVLQRASVGFDLAVTAVEGPASVLPGGEVEVRVEVCNQGTEYAGGENVSVYLSEDAVIEASDHLLGGEPLASLVPGACTALNARGPEPGLASSYTVGAIVESMYSSDVVPANNTLVGGTLVVGHEADLVVKSVTGPASVEPGMGFEIAVLVCNQGQSPANAEVEAVLSSDGIIDAGDTVVGYGFAMNLLEPGTCDTVLVPAVASEPDGVYTLGARVDFNQFEPELDENNNTAAGSSLSIGYGPDLIVKSVSGPNSAMSGGSIALSAEVCNQGTDFASFTDVEFFLSSDASIDNTDYPAGSAPVSELTPGSCTTVVADGYVGVPQDGVYMVGAIVDGYDGVFELRDDNNATAGARVGVGYEPDLVIASIEVPASAISGMDIDVSVEVCNWGQSEAWGVDVEVVLSGGGGAAEPLYYPLEPDDCHTLSISVPGAPDGVHTLTATVDISNSVSEIFEDNNTATSDLVAVGYEPDLVVSVDAPATAPLSGEALVEVEVCNRGQAPVHGVDIELYGSTDATITRSDMLAGFAHVSSLVPGRCTKRVADASFYAQPGGTLFAGAIVDPNESVPELREDNNASAGDAIAFGDEADLIVSAIDAPATASSGASLTAEVTVCNQGYSPAPAEVEVWTRGPYGDMFFGSSAGASPYLEPGDCERVFVSGSAPYDDGVHEFVATVDYHNYEPEILENNNTTIGGRFGVGYDADLFVAEVSAPLAGLPGDEFGVSARICNQGQMPSSPSYASFVLSQDGQADPGDFLAGDVFVDMLEPGACVDVNAQLFDPGFGDRFEVFVVADWQEMVPEIFEDNNATSGGVRVLGYLPELVIEAVSGPDSVMPGDTFEVTVRVCNIGTYGSYGTDVELYSSSPSPAGPGGPVGMAQVAPLPAGVCQNLRVEVWVDTYAEGAMTILAELDPYDTVTELIEDNNSGESAPIGVGYDADFTIASVWTPSTLMAGERFTAEVEVCNVGQSGASSDVKLWFSPSSSPSNYDTRVPTAWLEPDMCQVLRVVLDAPYEPGQQVTLVAEVGPDNWQPELRRDNNLGESEPFTVSY
ncbi:APHP domain protein [Haliangium ochraceum DSM 14365]|uniref:APHP domain protein n=1 Tax=Haliangium ochraceum (strain DSM 14365 / JCM 11303 / SMP-2) TaxID=502025 RepID=D0LZ12_HALO1|nr:APHP domain protein [Haliangium ochraceum DSM 14365]